MPLYQYRCNICGRTEERFRRVEDREKGYSCTPIDGQFRTKVFDEYGYRCSGIMIFQPIESMKGGTFKMHDPTEKEAQG